MIGSLASAVSGILVSFEKKENMKEIEVLQRCTEC